MAGLATPLKGLVGGTTAGSLLRERGIATVGDLLDLLPVRYLGHEARLSGLVVGDQTPKRVGRQHLCRGEMLCRKRRLATAGDPDQDHQRHRRHRDLNHG